MSKFQYGSVYNLELELKTQSSKHSPLKSRTTQLADVSPHIDGFPSDLCDRQALCLPGLEAAAQWSDVPGESSATATVFSASHDRLVEAFPEDNLVVVVVFLEVDLL